MCNRQSTRSKDFPKKISGKQTHPPCQVFKKKKRMNKNTSWLQESSLTELVLIIILSIYAAPSMLKALLSGWHPYSSPVRQLSIIIRYCGGGGGAKTKWAWPSFCACQPHINRHNTKKILLGGVECMGQMVLEATVLQGREGYHWQHNSHRDRGDVCELICWLRLTYALPCS